MSTRSVIGIPDGDGWKGRYCHSDGYPRWNGVKLQELVVRDGLEKVVQTVVVDNYGWSSIDPDVARLHVYQDDGRFKVVPDYGVAYTEVDGQTSPDEWHTYEGAQDSWCEWAYVLIPRGIQVFENVGKEWKHRGLVPYDSPDAMKAIEMEGAR